MRISAHLAAVTRRRPTGYATLASARSQAEPPVERRWIPPGDLGTFATLGAMRQAVNASLSNPVVRETARRSIAGIDGRDPVEIWRRLRSWLSARWHFVPDPRNVETVYTPPEQLRQLRETGELRGDCDDAATLSAALAKSLGRRVRFVVLGFFTKNDPFRHVYAEMWTPEGWRDFDVTRGVGPHPTPTRAATMEV